MKTIKPIEWLPGQEPDSFLCLLCRSGREATQIVIFGFESVFHMPVCWKCSQLSETELLDKIKPKNRNGMI